MKYLHITAAVVLGCVAMVLATGCKADSAPAAGFADNDAATKDPSLPFHRVWRKPGIDWSHYKKLYVADVNTSYMLKMTEWNKGLKREEIERDVRHLAVYTRDRVRGDFRDDPMHRFVVLDAPSTDPDALTFEIAIIEVVPSKVVINALGYAPFGIGMGVTAARMVMKDESSCAFEARGRDGASGEVVFTVADREAQQLTVVDARGMTWYSHAEGIIDDWSKQFVKIANRRPGETVEDTSQFRLKPW
jgi:hypothetical protein